MILHLTRHAPTAAPPEQIVGHRDVALSPAGRAEAERFAGRVAEGWAGLPPARLVSSDLARARDTAAPLAARWGLEIETDDRLREVHFGAWEGRTWKAVEQEDDEALTAWMTDWVHTPPPGGESFEALAERVAAWLGEQERGVPSHEAGAVFVVAHAGSLRALLCRALALPLEAAFGFAFDPLCRSRLERTEGAGRWTATLLNAPLKGALHCFGA